MNLRYLRFNGLAARALLAAGVVMALSAPFAAGAAANNKKNPTSKFYVADIDGDAQIDTGDRVDDLNKKSVYNAQGTIIETKANAANAMVFSNGTGIFFDEDTRVEVKQFEQEPFVPNRLDADVEPSVSQTHAMVPRGTVGLCTSKMVAGSSMTYSTPNGSVNIRGGKVVIQSAKGQTTISMLEGDSTVSAGSINLGGKSLQNGQQAVITDGAPGQPPQIKIQDIPPQDKSGLDAKVTMACTAKKTVYFEAKPTSVLPTPADTAAAPAASKSSSAPSADNSPVTAFDSPTVNAPTPPPTITTTPTINPTQQIVAVPVVPVNLPVQYTVSPASI